jgi:hypothetical protein
MPPDTLGWHWTERSKRWLGVVRGNLVRVSNIAAEPGLAEAAASSTSVPVAIAYRARELAVFRVADGELLQRLHVKKALGFERCECIRGAFRARGRTHDALVLVCGGDHGPCAAHALKAVELYWTQTAPTSPLTLHARTLTLTSTETGSADHNPVDLSKQLGAAFMPLLSDESVVSTVTYSDTTTTRPELSDCNRAADPRPGPCGVVYVHQVLVAVSGQPPAVLSLRSRAASAPFAFEDATLEQNEELVQAWPWASQLNWPLPRACLVLQCPCSGCRHEERKSCRLKTGLVIYDRVVGILCWRLRKPEAAAGAASDLRRALDVRVQFLRSLPTWVALQSTFADLRLPEDLPWLVLSRYERRPYQGHCPDLSMDDVLHCAGRLYWSLGDCRLEMPTRLENDAESSALVTLRWFQRKAGAPQELSLVPLDGCVDSLRYRDPQQKQQQENTRLCVLYADGRLLRLAAQPDGHPASWASFPAATSTEASWYLLATSWLKQLRPLEEPLGFINEQLVWTTFGRLLRAATESDGRVSALTPRTYPLTHDPAVVAAETQWDEASETITAAVVTSVAAERHPASSPSPLTAASAAYVRARWSVERGASLERLQYGFVMHHALSTEALEQQGRPTRLFALENEALLVALLSSEWPNRWTRVLVLHHRWEAGSSGSEPDWSAAFCSTDSTVALHQWHSWGEAIQVCTKQFVLLQWQKNRWTRLCIHQSDLTNDAFATDDARLFVLGQGHRLCLWMRSGSCAPLWYPYLSVELDAPVATITLDSRFLKVSRWLHDGWLVFALKWAGFSELSVAPPVTADLFSGQASSQEAGAGEALLRAAPVRSALRRTLNPTLSLELLGLGNGALVVNGECCFPFGFTEIQLRPCPATPATAACTTPGGDRDASVSPTISMVDPRSVEPPNEAMTPLLLLLVDGQLWLGVTSEHCSLGGQASALTLWPVLFPNSHPVRLVDCQAVMRTPTGIRCCDCIRSNDIDIRISTDDDTEQRGECAWRFCTHTQDDRIDDLDYESNSEHHHVHWSECACSTAPDVGSSGSRQHQEGNEATSSALLQSGRHLARLSLLWLDTDGIVHWGLVECALNGLRTHCKAGERPITALEYDACTDSIWTLLDGRPVALVPDSLRPRVIHDARGVLSNAFVDLCIPPVTPSEAFPASVRGEVLRALGDRLIALQDTNESVYLATARLEAGDVWLQAYPLETVGGDTTSSIGRLPRVGQRLRLGTSLVPETVLLVIERPRSFVLEAWTSRRDASSTWASEWRPERVAQCTLSGVDTFRLDPWSRPLVLTEIAGDGTLLLSGMYPDTPMSIPFRPGQHVELWRPNASNHVQLIGCCSRVRVYFGASGLVTVDHRTTSPAPREQVEGGARSPQAAIPARSSTGADARDSSNCSCTSCCSCSCCYPWPQGYVPCFYQPQVLTAGVVLSRYPNGHLVFSGAESHWATFSDGACLVWYPRRFSAGPC